MGAHSSAVAAYWAFFERFNLEDSAGWAAAMSYPHVRVSAAVRGADGGRFDTRTASGVYADEAEYAAVMETAGWYRFKRTGWVRTQGIIPRVIHRSPTKVHLAGGWTRYRADDSEIVSNRVLYVATQTEHGWGLQARFGVDSWSRTDDFTSTGEAAVEAAEGMAQLLAQGDYAALAERLWYPFTIVNVGEVIRIESETEQIENAAGRQLAAVRGSARVVQAGRTGVNVAWTLTEGGAEREEILLLVQRDGEWKLAAASALPLAEGATS